MNKKLEQLNTLCEQLKTGDEYRDAELRNIATIIDIMKKRILMGLDVEDDIRDIEERLDMLTKYPEWAGSHEHHRPTLVPTDKE